MGTGTSWTAGVRGRAASGLRGGLRAAARSRPGRHWLERIARELDLATRPPGGVDAPLLAAARTEAAAARLRRAAPPGAGGGTDAAVVTTLNRICRPDAWEDPVWLMYNRTLCLPQGDARFHRKAFEWTHCAYGLDQLGALTPEARVLGVAAGHECVLYYLCNRVGQVVATDLYAGDFAGGPAAEADPAFLTDPARFAPFPYRREALVPMAADALALPFDDRSFDVVYSLSSIEHFGGHSGSARGMREMARVLRPGGILCVATEWILEGGDDPELFTPAAFAEHVMGTPGLEQTGPLDVRPPSRALIDDPVWIDGSVRRTPHLVLGRGRLRWTSVIVFLRRAAAG